jgi:hypothetical protein
VRDRQIDRKKEEKKERKTYRQIDTQDLSFLSCFGGFLEKGHEFRHE